MKQDETASTEPGDPHSPDNEHEQPLHSGVMFGLAVVVGIFGGFGSIVFKAVIALCHNFFFYGELNLRFDPDVHMLPSPWGMGIILVPVVGAVIVNWITNTLAPEARGHGVPEVMNAIYYRQGRIRPGLVVTKAIASAVSIGTGGSVGREGPIIQVGSAFGSTLGQIIRMPARQRIVLVGAGAAAGIAATFNAPIGGLAFAIELMLVSISARNVALVAIATVTATYIGRFYSGMDPSFDVPQLAVFDDHLVGVYSLLACVPLGILVGCVSAGFIRSLYWMEDWFEERFRNSYLRHMAGMLVVGIMLYGFMTYAGNYYVGGVGYPTILDVLRRILSDPLFLAMLFLCKWLATILTLGSGASGGVFSPSLFLGATFGSLFGNLLLLVFPESGVDPVVFAVAAMAGTVAGMTGAVLTGITMTYEQTRDYAAMLPIITTVCIAYVVRARITNESIYTLKLVRRGMGVPQGLQAAISEIRTARTIMTREFDVVEMEDLQQWQSQHEPGEGSRYAVAVDDGAIQGIVREELQYLLRDQDPANVLDGNYFVVTPGTKWPVIMRGMRTKDCEKVLVIRNRRSLRGEDVVGVITPREIARTARESAHLLD